MSDTDVATPPVPPSAGRVGQITAVEQARAVAEVAAAVRVAQEVPRDVEQAVARMRKSCRQTPFAERSHYRYPRGGQQITGPSIHFARELARCWGNVQYGIHELRRDDVYGQSEMQAYAWDVETNARTVTTFVVKHTRDTQRGKQALTDDRDIYENNTNQGSRRVREMILAILPPWFVDEGRDLCLRTLADGGEGDQSRRPLESRVADWVEAFGRQGVTRDQLESKVGRPTRVWTDLDVAQLAIIGKSIARGETTIAAEFPTDAPSGAAAALAGTAEHAAAPAPPADTPDPGPAEAPWPDGPSDPGPMPPADEGANAGAEPPRSAGPAITSGQIGQVHGWAKRLGVPSGSDDYGKFLSELVGRPITSSTEMTADEAGLAIQRMKDRHAQGGTATAARPASDEWVHGNRALAAYAQLCTAAQSQHVPEARVRQTLEDRYQRPPEDLTADEIKALGANLRDGSVAWAPQP